MQTKKFKPLARSQFILFWIRKPMDRRRLNEQQEQKMFVFSTILKYGIFFSWPNVMFAAHKYANTPLFEHIYTYVVVGARFSGAGIFHVQCACLNNKMCCIIHAYQDQRAQFLIFVVIISKYLISLCMFGTCVHVHFGIFLFRRIFMALQIFV